MIETVRKDIAAAARTDRRRRADGAHGCCLVPDEAFRDDLYYRLNVMQMLGATTPGAHVCVCLS
jgi:hypothetical protein